MDQCRDPLQGTLVPERGGRLTAAGRQGAGRAQRALASDSGLENAGVHGRLSQPGSCMVPSVEAAPSQGVAVHREGLVSWPHFSIHGPEGGRCFVGRLLRSLLERSG